MRNRWLATKRLNHGNTALRARFDPEARTWNVSIKGPVAKGSRETLVAGYTSLLNEASREAATPHEAFERAAAAAALEIST